MMFADFILQWIYSLPVAQQGPTTVMICLFCLELLFGLLSIKATNDYVRAVKKSRGY